MGRKQILDLVFPAGGLDKRFAYQKQRPYTTPDCVNVRPFDTMEGRERGGSRPGLDKYAYDQLGSGNPVRLLTDVAVVDDDGVTNWVDNFRGGSMGTAWAVGSWAGSLPSITDGTFASITYASVATAVRAALTAFDSTLSYNVELFIVPYQGAHHGKYQIFVAMNDTTPVATTNGLVFEITITGATGVYTGEVRRYSGGALASTTAFTGGTVGDARAGWFTVNRNGTNVTATLFGTSILGSTSLAAPAAGGERVGFGMEATVSGGICLVDSFRAQYRTDDNTQVLRRIVVASSNGVLSKEVFTGDLDTVSSSLTLASDRELRAAERGQKLYIADNGNPRVTGTDGVTNGAGTLLDSASVSDWTTLSISTADDVVNVVSGIGATAGTYRINTIHATNGLTLDVSAGASASGITFRVERGAKIYDAVANTLAMWNATTDKGNVPVGCQVVTVFNDRLVLAAQPLAPHAWFASRQGDPLDFDYSQPASDAQRAVQGTSTDQAQPGDPIRALVTGGDSVSEYMVVGCDQSIWIVRGNPATDGAMRNLSRLVGIVDKKAWCFGPSGELLFMARDGLYMMPPGGGFPQSVSRERLPNELRNLDNTMHTTLLAYDVVDRGVHIWTTPTHYRNQDHWWFDWRNKGFWPVRVGTGNHEPFSIHEHVSEVAENSCVIMGCRDGYVRRFRDTQETDDGTTFSSYVSYGPIRLGGNDYLVGLITEMFCATDNDSGDVDWAIRVGNTADDAIEASALYTGEWNTSGLNLKARVRARGHSAVVRLSNGETRSWAVERLGLVRKTAGKQRAS